jgi:DNA invertase Pin-like site-specific DNA recombinase
LNPKTPLKEIIEASVDVVTLNDGKRYDATSLDGMDLFVALVSMMRAHEESETKSRRIKASWAGRRKEYGPEAIVPGQCYPFWLRGKFSRTSKIAA